MLMSISKNLEYFTRNIQRISSLFWLILCVFSFACESSSTSSTTSSVMIDMASEIPRILDQSLQDMQSDVSRDPDQTLDQMLWQGEDQRMNDQGLSDQIQFDQEVMDQELNSPHVTFTLETPLDQSSFSTTSTIPFRASLQAEHIDPRTLAIYLSSSIQGSLPIQYDPENQLITGELYGLRQGVHQLTLSALAHPHYEWTTEITLTIQCGVTTSFDEPLDPAQWYIMGEAYRSEGGWLEMTRQRPSTMGGIFLIGSPMEPSNLDVSFRIAVEAELDLNVPLNEQVSDGLAMTFWNIIPSMVPILEPAWIPSGSKMGYGFYRSALMEVTAETGVVRPEAFTIEFDTFYNRCTINPHNDPTTDPHVAITYDGYLIYPHHTLDDNDNSVEIPVSEVCSYPIPSDDPNHPWASIPSLLDGDWHDVRITIEQGRVSVYFDQQEVISSSEIARRFKGGILAFSGGSGAVPSHLKFDDLNLSGTCQYSSQ